MNADDSVSCFPKPLPSWSSSWRCPDLPGGSVRSPLWWSTDGSLRSSYRDIARTPAAFCSLTHGVQTEGRKEWVSGWVDEWVGSPADRESWAVRRQRRSEAGAAHRKPYSAGLTSGLVRRLPLCFSCVRAGFPFEIKDSFLIEMCRSKRVLGTFILVGTLY